MSEQWASRLPTIDKLGVAVPQDVDANPIAAAWLHRFSTSITAKDIDGLLSILQPDAFWRDILALTWDFRTFNGVDRIRAFANDRLFPVSTMNNFKMRDFVRFQMQFADVAWILATFDFTTDVGVGLGIVRLVSTESGEWKAFTIFTNLEELSQFPELIGARRASEPNVDWHPKREEELAFQDTEPAVLIIGGNTSGLSLAARLKYLGVPTVVVESDPNVGDIWRKRYSSLCLHFPVQSEHMPYLPFPPTWPLYTPALKIAEWLEFYARTLDLNVWTSSTVTHAVQDETTGVWTVTVKRIHTPDRVFCVRHLVFATGIGVPRIPAYPGMESFQGQMFHSEKYKTATDYSGRKILVVGSGNSAHDIASDLAKHGEDVTMFQRHATFVMNLRTGWKFMGGGVLYSEDAPPVDLADRISESLPQLLKENGMAQRGVKAAMASDSEMLAGIIKAGFKVNAGIKDTGYLILAKDRSGGHVFDVGSCRLIINGDIKDQERHMLEADVVIFATGYSDAVEHIRAVCGDLVANKCKTLWGLDSEGEIKGVWRDTGIKNLWYMVGSLAMNRFHSKHLALQIKAIEENVFGTRFSLDA
ncbi:hypothetical protein DFH09DRAFT_1365485 [Mycena vulgaris]|nr:hypothetical protein DFH09DRAFT_1365485 [Mycena vulgaris]